MVPQHHATCKEQYEYLKQAFACPSIDESIKNISNCHKQTTYDASFTRRAIKVVVFVDIVLEIDTG